jgi:hypothetical protein
VKPQMPRGCREFLKKEQHLQPWRWTWDIVDGDIVLCPKTWPQVLRCQEGRGSFRFQCQERRGHKGGHYSCSFAHGGLFGEEVWGDKEI